ncbi:hypothetical protein J8281_16600 [Aquimarina sp. U1-2]|uniref:hypothetical protein n=1 Tax=Aquimarina sp. U1-2 TaxID=2823141 RepID=UPI001AECE84B|nr:hypothetical protein [Aquimarina sp. U1-2]MBP2833817.1 hypothetical protein [Aquimarina sp. U1-2]
MKNNTTSILLNVLASFIALFFIIGGIGMLIEGETVAGLLLIVACIIISPLTKLILKTIKRDTVKIIRIVAPIILFFIASLFYSLDSMKEFKVKADKNKLEKQKLAQLKDSLNYSLSQKDLSVCKIITDISTIESNCIKEADKKYPDFGQKHNDYTYELIEKRTKEYLDQKQIDSITYDNIRLFIMDCTEAERQAKIAETKRKKAQLRSQRETVEKCLEAACSIVPDKIKASLHNPKSFEKVNCEYLGSKGNNFSIRITYRGENAYGAIRTEQAIATVEIETCDLVKISQ